MDVLKNIFTSGEERVAGKWNVPLCTLVAPFSEPHAWTVGSDVFVALFSL